MAPGVWDCAVNLDPNAGLNFEQGQCVPFNPYQIIANGQNSPGLFPQDLLNYITSTEVGETKFDQKLIMAYPEPAVFSQWQADIAIGANAKPTLEALAKAVDKPSPDRLAWGDGIHAK